MPIFWGLIIGSIGGFFAGLLGIGGGIFLVPLIILLQGKNFLQAKAMALFVILVSTAPLGLIRHHIYKGVKWKTGFILGGCGILGSTCGASLSRYLALGLLECVFGIVLFFTAARVYGLFFQPGRIYIPNFILGFGAGFLAGLIGIGGGAIMVSGMILSDISIHKAIGTSFLGIIFNALGATLIHSKLELLNIKEAVPIVVGAGFSVWIGAKVAHQTNTQRLKKIFALFLTILGIYMFIRGILAG
jgi:hypothetical protein